LIVRKSWRRRPLQPVVVTAIARQRVGPWFGRRPTATPAGQLAVSREARLE
jgi:hypothetical protein